MTKKIFLITTVIIILLLFVNFKKIASIIYPVHYENYVKKYSVKYDIDPYLVFSLIKVESKFNPYAKSNKGAIGLMQITPSTGKYISTKLGDSEFSDDKLYDPEKNIEYGCFYVAKLKKDFNGDMECILLAYNGGEGNVRKWLKDLNSRNAGIDYRSFPFAETRQYVVRVEKNYRLYRYIYAK